MRGSGAACGSPAGGVSRWSPGRLPARPSPWGPAVHPFDGAPMRPALSEWDAEYVRSVVTAADETLDVEKKASAKFDPDTKKKETREELAKQVCAFSNVGRGFLVYGVNDSGALDAGVPDVALGREPAKAWVEAQIPNLVEPA